MEDRKSKITYRASLAGGLAIQLLAMPASSQVGENYEISNSTVDGGGGTAGGGEYAVTGSIGQWDTGTQSLNGGEYRVTGGFWAATGEGNKPDIIFISGFETE